MNTKIITIASLLSIFFLAGCDEKKPELSIEEQAKQYQCSDYQNITNDEVKAALLKRCPRINTNFVPSTSSKGMLSE
ncbi:entry exclusion lipoprotein TrbK [Zophobihabitans entericus]|uniref:Entry exclusion lipoprotein TrbK n=1 Tax=Zophobihabitans entericus TaxID=1635327 RepID=A0A6G9IFX1_9GAMM|nr:entry exclusion lipoprotein TrbK [Zophobihabitans entericus]QIQ22510.1 entry exclusion lipoprotein TrbK [Zophobihabitans entericus]